MESVFLAYFHFTVMYLEMEGGKMSLEHLEEEVGGEVEGVSGKQS